MVFQTVSKVHRPHISDSVVIPRLARKSHWYSYKTNFPNIPETPRFYNERLQAARNPFSAKPSMYDYNVPQKCPDCNKIAQCINIRPDFPRKKCKFSFLNINLSKITARKLEILVKERHEVAIFALNELSLSKQDCENITPAGYKLYPAPADSVGKIYAAILCKEELSQCIKQVKTDFPMFAKIIIKKRRF